MLTWPFWTDCYFRMKCACYNYTVAIFMNIACEKAQKVEGLCTASHKGERLHPPFPPSVTLM